MTAHAVKEVDAALQVGGPAISPGADEWLAAVRRVRRPAAPCPIDFVSRHAYTSGPAQHVPFGVHQTLAPAAQPAGAVRHARGGSCAGTALAGLPVHITEFNSSYRPDNPVHDTAFHAAYLAPVLAAGGDLVDSFSYWTFSDMFEEVGVPTALFHGGFGLLTHRQIKKPTYHLYAFMARMGDQVLARGRGPPGHPGRRRPGHGAGVGAGGRHRRQPSDRHRCALSVPVGRRSAAFVLRSSVNEEAGNAWAAWCEMGRPRSPRPAARHAAGGRRAGPRPPRLPVVGGRVDLDLTLARHEVTLVEITPVSATRPRPGGTTTGFIG